MPGKSQDFGKDSCANQRTPLPLICTRILWISGKCGTILTLHSETYPKNSHSVSASVFLILLIQLPYKARGVMTERKGVFMEILPAVWRVLLISYSYLTRPYFYNSGLIHSSWAFSPGVILPRAQWYVRSNYMFPKDIYWELKHLYLLPC